MAITITNPADIVADFLSNYIVADREAELAAIANLGADYVDSLCAELGSQYSSRFITAFVNRFSAI